MKLLPKLFSAVGLSCVIALSLAVISQVQDHAEDDADSQAVVSLAYGNMLHDGNLVDYMARMSLELGIRKLDWREPVLYVDMYTMNPGASREHIFMDIQQVSFFGLRSMLNVEQVLIRIYEGRSRQSPLLLAVTADRSYAADMPDGRAEGNEEPTAEQFVREAFRVQATQRWAELYS